MSVAEVERRLDADQTRPQHSSPSARVTLMLNKGFERRRLAGEAQIVLLNTPVSNRGCFDVAPVPYC